MARTPRNPFVRAVAYALAAALLGVGVGTVQEGSLGGGLVLGIAVGLGVAIGLVGYELATRGS